MTYLNLGILAHVDAGKTSLTERLLYAAGIIDTVGSVDNGSTQTDSLALERQRGITIRSAVATLALGDTTVNVIDTPGHPDFIAEVERVLAVLDGAVLVVSAVEGVQPQTRVLMRTLQRLRIPTLIFVNKIDRRGAQDSAVLRSIAERLTPNIVAMGSVSRLGKPEATSTPYADDPGFHARLVDLLAETDDALMSAYVTDEAQVSLCRLRAQLKEHTARGLVYPVFFGSAITGAGVGALAAGIAELLPAAGEDVDGPASGTVFKIERGSAGEKVAYVRMFAGEVRVRERLDPRSGQSPKVTAIHVFDRGSASRRASVRAGQIARVWGLDDVRIGDPVGVPHTRGQGQVFAPPTLETVIAPRRLEDRATLYAALAQLAEQDPLINLRQDPVRREVSLSLYGEVQKEVVEATLADEYGVEVTFSETTTVCIERPVGSGAAVEVIAEDPNPFLATVGLRVDPAPGAGVSFRLGVELGSMPPAFFTAVEETVHETLRQGLFGWQVTDCSVTMTHSGYWARQSHAGGTFDKSMSSTAGDFRELTPLVLMDALKRAGTRVYEPIHRFSLELPADALSAIYPELARLRAVPAGPVLHDSTYTLTGDAPAASVHRLQQRLAGLTHGEGFLESEFDRYQLVSGPLPSRLRWDHNPLDRKEYLQNLRRMPGA